MLHFSKRVLQKSKTPALVLAFALGLSACSNMDRYVEYETIQPERYPTIKATGYAPIASQPADTEEERILLAIRASKLEAYRELSEQVQGVYLVGNTTVAQMAIQDDQFRTEINGLVRGAEVIRSYPVGEYYATELQVNFEHVENLYISTTRPTRMSRVRYY